MILYIIYFLLSSSIRGRHIIGSNNSLCSENMLSFSDSYTENIPFPHYWINEVCVGLDLITIFWHTPNIILAHGKSVRPVGAAVTLNYSILNIGRLGILLT